MATRVRSLVAFSYMSGALVKSSYTLIPLCQKMSFFYVVSKILVFYICPMYMGSFFLICHQCQRKVRQLTKDLDRVKSRVCPDCGASIKVKENSKNLTIEPFKVVC